MGFGREPAREIVERRGDAGAFRDIAAELIGDVENVGAGGHPIEQRKAGRVGGVEESETRICGKRAERGALVSEAAETIEEREGAYFTGAREAGEGADPVIGIILDAGAAQQQRSGVNQDPHDW